mmetsp:Transcript_13039/g.23950  ORF Transcript_13039/g.23950 Transcript_13039/m.23950 type:complete len:445 (+) Transcript_13039:56-1390(+)|eukprot:CAMPEP_0201915210 /NCGR_PEP_ID=MMETSP0903-20130614/5199_1 /ASSEMBLY_ACC=CAM_ASM_000552 /TAXON_ID=420261 /ORGANISM="Thalassiosira antarctica, Strain CCMP982" /LENGTH=444 /DNA_ID=CAMNT_0048450781 /DNA_START=30 /DNA_END=1364 /DNA_ORIENTATION=-
MASSSRNAAQSLALSAKRALEPRPAQFYQYYRNINPSCRNKSSIPFLSSNTHHDNNDIYERASHNATTFDTNHQLSQKDTIFSSWRSRQKNMTKQNPMKPHPKLPPKLIPPSPQYPPSFFPPYAHSGRIGPPQLSPDEVLIHDEPSIKRMTHAARVARKLLDYVCHPSIAKVGQTTEEIDKLLHKAALEQGAYPSPLNYFQFPKSVCSSINEVVCHGIPDSRPLELGDVVSFDVSCFVGGVHGDNCATVVVGDVDDGFDEEFSWDGDSRASSVGAVENHETKTPNQSSPQKDWPSTIVPHKLSFASPEEEERFVTARRLVQAALESRDEGVAACRPGGCLSDVGGAIHAVADAYGYDTVRPYRGHGISSDFHCAPFVKHFRNNDAMELLPGMIFTIEPMITEGSAECSEWSDDWTVVTQDGGRAAQFEHTVLITESGVEILTLP